MRNVNRTIVPGGKVSDEGKKVDEAKKEERERRVRALQSGFRAIVSEMKRVTWPSREEWVSATLVTIGLVIIVALWTTAVGTVAQWFFQTGK